MIVPRRTTISSKLVALPTLTGQGRAGDCGILSELSTHGESCGMSSPVPVIITQGQIIACKATIALLQLE